MLQRRSWDAAWGDIGDIFSAVWDAVTAPLEAFPDALGELPGKIASATVGMFDGIWDAFKGVLEDMLGAWNRIDLGFNVSIPGWVPGVGGNSFGVDDLVPDIRIPSFHSGGVFRTAAPGGEGIAIVRDGEAYGATVATRQGPAGGAGDTFVLQVDRRELGRVVRDELRDLSLREGAIPVIVQAP